MFDFIRTAKDIDEMNAVWTDDSLSTEEAITLTSDLEKKIERKGMWQFGILTAVGTIAVIAIAFALSGNEDEETETETE